MSGKLTRTLVKEFKKSPGKTAVLVAMCPVAIYFCGPLLMGMLPKSKKPAGPAPAIADSAPPFSLPAVATAAAPAQASRPSWQEVAGWMAVDMFAVPARIPTGVRNPFHNTPQPTDEQAEALSDDSEEVAVVQTPERPLTLEDLGLRLTATMVSPHIKLATINGQPYEENDRIAALAEHNGRVREVWIELLEIGNREVTIRFGNETYQLRLAGEIPANAILVKPIAN